jgi:4-diphosphocytidyl-2-C-methyl-D-erythritol kinase
LGLFALAPAKVNLTLEVLGRRADGYHELRSVMLAVSLCDELRVEPADHTSIACDLPALATPENLAFRPVELVRAELGRPDGLRITLAKRIPEAAGLGGGSSDGAAALELAQTAWGVRLPAERERDLALRLGSDVPFFLGTGAAEIAGRGEICRALAVPDCWLVLMHPPMKLPTAGVFRAVGPADYTDGARTRELASRITRGESLLPAWLFNGLERAAFVSRPELAGYRDRMAACGVEAIHVSGSGPTLFAPARDQARRAHGAEPWGSRLSGHGRRANVPR